METNKQILVDNLEFCKQHLIDALLDLYVNNDDGKGWILPDELKGTNKLISDLIEHTEILIRNI